MPGAAVLFLHLCGGWCLRERAASHVSGVLLDRFVFTRRWGGEKRGGWQSEARVASMLSSFLWLISHPGHLSACMRVPDLQLYLC